MGEFNVNKSDGTLVQTAGIPDTYPSTQVTYGEDTVENALDKLQPKILIYDYYSQHSSSFFSVPANSTANATITVPDVSGYSKWCIIHLYSSSNANLAPVINGYKTGDNTVTATLKNFTNSAVSANPNVYVMYYND